MEPCGCAGLDRMKGGMSRRATLFRELRQKGWPVVGLDVGGLVQGFGQPGRTEVPNRGRGEAQDGLRGDRFRRRRSPPARRRVACRGGRRERQTQPLRRGQRRPVGQAGRDHASKPRHRGRRHEDRRHRRAGQDNIRRRSTTTEIEMSDPEAALEKIVPELKQKADYLVLLAHATMEESIELGKKFPAFNVVVTSDGPPEPPDGAASDQRDQDPADHGRLQGAERHRAGPVRRRPRADPLPARAVGFAFPRLARHEDADGGLSRAAQGDRVCRTGAAARAASAVGNQRPIHRLAEMRRVVPREVVRHLEAQRARPRLPDAGGSRSAAELRSRVRQLPRDGLESGQVLSVRRAATRARRRRRS